jgi:hypothetical protein
MSTKKDRAAFALNPDLRVVVAEIGLVIGWNEFRAEYLRAVKS